MVAVAAPLIRPVARAPARRPARMGRAARCWTPPRRHRGHRGRGRGGGSGPDREALDHLVVEPDPGAAGRLHRDPVEQDLGRGQRRSGGPGRAGRYLLHRRRGAMTAIDRRRPGGRRRRHRPSADSGAGGAAPAHHRRHARTGVLHRPAALVVAPGAGRGLRRWGTQPAGSRAEVPVQRASSASSSASSKPARRRSSRLSGQRTGPRWCWSSSANPVR